MTEKKETVAKETRKRQLIKNETARALLYGLGLAVWVFAAFTAVQIISVLFISVTSKTTRPLFTSILSPGFKSSARPE